MPLRGRRLGRDAWIVAAQEALIEGGLEAMKIGRLAKALKAERGSFYHHFESRDALLHELRERWEQTSTQAYDVATDADGREAEAALEKINSMWLEEDPAFDTAMREWARTDTKVARAVRRADNERIRLLERIYRELGYKGDRALVRARVAYFHQVGYLALGLCETRKRRRELAPLYLEVLVGN